ncbi:MFS transporter [Paenibacillus sp. JCM 10914]|uniref:MFS transporter n=1 Tax=Paenibacillus sp. JCM 10914 TaxID=1236974 RepID=UPI0003CC7A82|nr:MFS transporter [Paenibacillus sp. JCM 10914]GAE07386.1 MFS general substrate transporter [Paenibacillus sp. JCM 10914]
MEIMKNRNFLLLFIGRILTNVGDSLYAVAAMWLVYDLGGSTLYTGIAGFLSILPRIIQILSGPMIDRVPLKGLLVNTQLIQAIMLLIVPISHYFGFLSVGLVLTITPILTTLNMWVYPAQMTALPRIVEKRQLTQGNSLFSLANQGIDVACNAISGVLIVVLGAVSLYLWNSAGFFIGALLFAQLKISHNQNKNSDNNEKKTSKKPIFRSKNMQASMKKYGADIKEGMRYMFATPLARIQIGIIVINAAGGATFTVMPAFADSLGGASVYGMLLMASACGSLLGALLTPYLKLERLPLGHLFIGAFILSGTAWGLSVFTPWTWLVVLVYGLAWFPGGVTNVIIISVIQKAIPQKRLGTVLAAANGISGIAMPLGSLIGGILGVVFTGATVIAACGATVLGVGLFWMIDSVTRSLPSPEEATEEWFSSYTGEVKIEKEVALHSAT